MDKYINQQTLQNALERKQCGPANQRYTDGWNDCLLRVKSMVSKAPAADVAPVVHGRWISFLDGDHIMPERYYRCSRCGRVESRRQPYCHCGAKMDGGADHAST